MLLGSALMLASTMIGALTRVGIVALLARHYSREEFGLWSTLTSATAILMTSDFGVTNVLRNRVSELAAKGPAGDDEARESYLAVFYFFLAASVLLSLGVLLLARYLPLAALFKTPDAALQQAGITVLLTVQFLMFLGIPFTAGLACFFSYQEAQYYALFTAAQALASTVAVVALAAADAPIATVAICYFAAILLTAIGFTALLLRRRRWSPRQVAVRRIVPRVTGMLSLGLRFAAAQISNSFVFNSATIVASASLGVAQAAEYNLVQKLYGFGVTLFLSVLNPVWAGYAHAAERGDWLWCRRTLRTTILGTVIAFGVATLAMAWQGNALLRLLAGPGYTSDLRLYLLVGAGTLLYVSWVCASTFQNAIGRIDLLTALLVLAAVLVIPISRWMAARWGLSGVAAAAAVIWVPLAAAIPIQGFAIIRRRRSAAGRPVAEAA